MIHEFMLYIFVRNSTSATPISKLIALEGEEIGKLLAQSLEDGVTEKQPWYEPSEKLPDQPVISSSMDTNFDTVIVDEFTPKARAPQAVDTDAEPSRSFQYKSVG